MCNALCLLNVVQQMVKNPSISDVDSALSAIPTDSPSEKDKLISEYGYFQHATKIFIGFLRKHGINGAKYVIDTLHYLDIAIKTFISTLSTTSISKGLIIKIPRWRQKVVLAVELVLSKDSTLFLRSLKPRKRGIKVMGCRRLSISFH